MPRGWPRGTGPVAIDAERASGYRYSNRAYLIQLRRNGAGTALIDPIAFDVPRAAAGGARGHRVDPARRHPGPPLPQRDRPAPRRALRHRARRAAARLPARRAGHPGRDPAGLPDEEGALGRRLVDPPAAGVVARVRRARRRGPRRAARPSRRRARGGRQGRVGPPGVRRTCAASIAPVRDEAWRRTSGMHRVRGRRASPPCGRCGRHATSIASHRDVTPGRIIPDAATRRRRLGACRPTATRCWSPRASTAAAPSATPTAGWRPSTAPPPSTRTTCRPRSPRGDGPPVPRAWAEKDPVAGRRLALARDAMAQLSRAAQRAAREPPHARHPAPGALDPARNPRRRRPPRRGRRPARRPRRPAAGRSR